MKTTTPQKLPLILVVFNRPEHTRRVLEALRQQNASNLYIFCDAPRSEADKKGVDETRDLVESIDWTTPFIKHNTSNQGLANNIRNSVDLVFQKEDEVVLLEDDCVPQPYFLQFMYDCLKQYENSPNVFGVSGYSIPIPSALRAKYPHDLYFYPRIGSWGWATWKSRWAFHERDLLALVKKCLDTGIDLTQGGTDVVENLELLINGQLKDVWTFHWILSVYLQRGMYIYPTISQIENIGMDGTGVHCAPTDKFNTVLADAPAVRFPQSIVLDEGLFELFQSYYDSLEGDVSESFRRLRENVQPTASAGDQVGGIPQTTLSSARLEVPSVGSINTAVQGNTSKENYSSDNRVFLDIMNRCAALFSSTNPSEQLKALLESDQEIMTVGKKHVSIDSHPFGDERNAEGLLCYWTGLTLFARGEYSPALDTFQESIKTGFSHPRILWYMAESLRNLGLHSEAKEQEDRLFELIPDFPRQL